MIKLKYHFSIKNHYILLSAYITAAVFFNSSQPRGNLFSQPVSLDIPENKFRRNDVPCFPCPLVSYKCFLVVGFGFGLLFVCFVGFLL